ncbi:hypothetical protein JAO29_11295 [Edaphobacter sp. HDX4]|uniref:hypothetical protein n=1 Tax=Edaphobacter sp. HDX4 TaxID=2794064 RepID=UPI002FE6C31E
MAAPIDVEKFDIKKFAETLVKAGREGVKWERRKLDWVREEKAEEAKAKSDAA